MAKHDLIFEPPIMNAVGCLGFTPDVYGLVDLSHLGAFVTNPISLSPRTPARGLRYIDYRGGFLLHTGFPNPGLSSVLHRYERQWSRSPVPVIVHLIARNSEELASMARRLESISGVSGLEIGFPIDASSELVMASIRAALGELPVIAQLPFERCSELAAGAIEAGAAVISMAAPRGVLVSNAGNQVQGRLYGPAILPMALRLVNELKARNIPVIGAGGIYAREDIHSMLAAGAVAVQLDSVLWRGINF
jgi:dihydroorotate dehydrogenase (NAD+) catalytic subunit